MKKRVISEFFGGNDIREPIFVLGKKMYIKLLTVYEMVLCDTESSKLTEILINDGIEEDKAKVISENSCLVSMCLYSIKSKRIFKDGLDAMQSLTIEELNKITNEYIEVKNRFLSFGDLTLEEVNGLKKN